MNKQQLYHHLFFIILVKKFCIWKESDIYWLVTVVVVFLMALPTILGFRMPLIYFYLSIDRLVFFSCFKTWTTIHESIFKIRKKNVNTHHVTFISFFFLSLIELNWIPKQTSTHTHTHKHTGAQKSSKLCVCVCVCVPSDSQYVSFINSQFFSSLRLVYGK